MCSSDEPEQLVGLPPGDRAVAARGGGPRHHLLRLQGRVYTSEFNPTKLRLGFQIDLSCPGMGE